MISKSFTDIYGQQHDQAVILVDNAYYNYNCHESHVINLDSTDYTNTDYTNTIPDTSDNSSSSLRFTAVYWESQADFEAGELPKRLLCRCFLVFDELENLLESGDKTFKDMETFEVENLPDRFKNMSTLEKAETVLNELLG